MKRIKDILIGEVIMMVVFIATCIAYEGIAYIDIDTIMRIIRIAIFMLVISIPIGSIGLLGAESFKIEFRHYREEFNKKRKVEA